MTLSFARRGRLLFFGGLLASSLAYGSGTEKREPRYDIPRLDHSYTLWNTLLVKSISDTKGDGFDFNNIKAVQTELKKELVVFQSVSLSEYTGFSREQKMSFLINAHNILFINAALESADPSSFTGFNPDHKIDILGESYSQELFITKHVRRGIADPKGYFALFCLRKKCPELYREAVTPEKVDSQLREIISLFFSDKKKNYYSVKKKTLFLSPLIKEYENEIVRVSGYVSAFVSDFVFSDPKLRRMAQVGKIKIKYLD